MRPASSIRREVFIDDRKTDMVRESNVKSYHCSLLPGRATNFSITPVGSDEVRLAGNSISDDPVSEMALNLSMLAEVFLLVGAGASVR